MKDQLSSLGGGGDGTAAPVKEQQSSGSRRRSVLFPGKGGIVVEDSPFVARDVLLDQLLGRVGTAGSGKPAFISWVEPEEGQMGVENDSPPPFGAGGGIADAFLSGGPGGRVTQPPPPASSLSGEREREQERLQSIKSRVGARQPPPTQSQQQINTRDQHIRGPPVTIQQPIKTSSKAREQERLLGMKAKVLGIGVGDRPGQVPVSPTSASVERTTLGMDDPFKSSSKERENRRLQEMKAAGGGVVAGPLVDVRALEEAHRVELA